MVFAYLPEMNLIEYKGFHIIDNQFVDSVIKWPLNEIQGPPLKLVSTDIENVKKTFLQAWQIRKNSQISKSCMILNLALESYYFSSTLTETRTIFLHLMIAFESLFKKTRRRLCQCCQLTFSKITLKDKRTVQ